MTPDETAALAAAARWRLLGLLLERPRPGWRDEVARLAAEVREPSLLAVAAAAHHATEGTYLRVLGPGGALSPREVAYRGFEDPGWVLADLARFYDAFAYRPRAEDPLDHVAVEAGFVAYLFLKEALALAGGDVEAARTTAAARTDFLEAHVAAIATPLADRVAGTGESFLTAAAAALAAAAPRPRIPPAAPRPETGGCGTCGDFP
jgi:nitrate reductase delta subunit